MKLLREARAGSLESADCLVMVSLVEPGTGRQVTIESVVQKEFGEQIRASVLAKLSELQVSDASVSLKDRGALDYVIKARVETALRRACEGGDTLD